MLGTNGGGFFNANSAHPLRTPRRSPTSSRCSIFIIPAGPHLYAGPHDRLAGPRLGRAGRHVRALRRRIRHRLLGRIAPPSTDSRRRPDRHRTAPGGNMEGKEVRNGIAESSLFATITTDASCGAVNGMHDSFTPLGGMVVLINIMMGEVVFGGVGSGLYGMTHLRRALGLHRRPHGGPHSRVPGQEDRSLRREDVHALRAHLPPHHPHAHRHLCALAHHRAFQPEQSGAARASPRFSTPSPPERATTARPLPAQRQYLVVQRGAGLGHAVRAASS
jgi:hypothetical protein